MKTFPVLGLAIVLLAVSTSGLSAAETTLAGEEFVGSGYTIETPDGWSVREGFMGTDYLAQRPPEGKDQFLENINVVLENIPEGVESQVYVDANIQNIENMSGEPIIAHEQVQLNGRQADKIEYTLTFGAMNLHNDAYLIVENQAGYIITLSTLAGASREKWNPILTEVARTFAIE